MTHYDSRPSVLKRMLPLLLVLGRLVWVCEADGQIVKPRDIFHGRHVSERDRRGRVVSLCGYVHRARIGDSTAVGLVGDVR